MEQVIYKIVNLVNGKFYVGSTINKKVRFRQHRKLLRGKRHHCKHLQAAWNLYGEEKFVFVVVENLPEGESLEQAEDRWLQEHVGKDHCYNSGYSSKAPWRGVKGKNHPQFGTTLSQEKKEKISQTLKAYYAEDYFNHPRVGKTHSEETKARISAAKKGNPTRHWEGRARSEETRRKISEAQRGKPKPPGRVVSPEGRAKIRANIEAGRSHMHWLGRTHTEESRAKMSRPVEELTTGRVFKSVSEATEFFGLKMPTVIRSLARDKPLSKGPKKGLHFRYVVRDAHRNDACDDSLSIEPRT